MQEHYNENYVESDKYPTAEFNGQIVEKIDYSKDGVFNVTLKGKFKVHGVEKEYTIPAKLTIKDGKITVNCSFDVKLDDHKIDRPTVVAKQLADTIKVTVDATLVPHK
jgi:polyisoprenoid-binding protein YceI